jgi:TolB-like protein
MSSFVHELKRRKVVRVAAVYAATAFVLLQAADLILPALLLPEWTYRMLVLLALFGFPVALVLGWAFELTPEGVRVTTSAPAATGEAPPALLGRRTIIATALLVMLGIGLGAGLFLAPATVRESGASHAGSVVNDVADRSIAVLPFADLSEAGDQKWFADGIAEEILTSLSRLRELRVVGRSSSFLFAAGELDDRRIADTLGVAHLVKGSVRRVGGQLRVTAQLVRAADGVQLWSDAYDRDAAALLDVQRDVAEQIAATLNVLLDDERRERMFAAGTRNVEAFENYLRGRELFMEAHRGGAGVTLADANVWLARAMALDPGFAAPALLHADHFAHLVVDGPRPPSFVGPHDPTPQQAIERLRADFDHAARARDPHARVVAEINRVFFSTSWHRLPSLLDELERHAADSPLVDDPWGSHLTVVLGRVPLARTLSERLVRSDPLSPIAWAQRIHVELAAGDFAAARSLIAQARRALPDPAPLDTYELFAALLAGDRDGVLEHLTQVSEQIGYAAAVRGDVEAARARVRALEATLAWPHARMLLVYHQLGDREASRELVRRIDALPAGSVMLARELSINGVALTFDPADAPNFSARLREAGVDPASLRVMPRLKVPEAGS